MTILKDMNELNWVEVCALDDITPNTGVGALIENQQIALFRVGPVSYTRLRAHET